MAEKLQIPNIKLQRNLKHSAPNIWFGLYREIARKGTLRIEAFGPRGNTNLRGSGAISSSDFESGLRDFTRAGAFRYAVRPYWNYSCFQKLRPMFSRYEMKKHNPNTKPLNVDHNVHLESDSWPSEQIALKEQGNKPGERHVFDLEERTAVFGEEIVKFSRKIPRNPTNDRLTDQLVGCGTSIGANYCEANEGVSKKDFRHPVSRCVKEAKETKFFLRMVVASEPELAEQARTLYREANELMLIFASMYRK